MIDKRLIGTWKSDARWTLKELRQRKNFSELKCLPKVFGKLEIRYTRKKYYTSLLGENSGRYEYEVVAKDATSVVIRLKNTMFEEDKLQQINFDGPRYWVCLGGIHEWFKRID